MDDDLKAVHEARIRALVTGDLDTLDRCVADDLTYISPHGRVLSKQDVFDSIRAGKMTIQTDFICLYCSFHSNILRFQAYISRLSILFFRGSRFFLAKNH